MPWYPFSSTIWRARIGLADLLRPKTGSFLAENAFAWTQFYVDEERHQESFGARKFASMLIQHGCPDVGNPLPNDDESHFLIHPGGFISGEFDRCLRPAESPLDAQRGEQALCRIGLLSHLNCRMISARSYWADEDIQYAMALSCMEGRWELYGARPSRVIVNALRNGLLDPKVAPGAMIARQIAEESWHVAPWERTGPRSNKKNAPLTEAPAINIKSWRAGRGETQLASGAATEQNDGAGLKSDVL